MECLESWGGTKLRSLVLNEARANAKVHDLGLQADKGFLISSLFEIEYCHYVSDTPYTYLQNVRLFKRLVL